MELSVFTLNCWGIAVVSKDRKQRMLAIADHLNGAGYDFVFLQEVWVEDDYRLLTETCTKKLPFSHYFRSGVVGAGVCILSRWPINRVFFHGWPVNGYIHKVHHGDWWGGKGVGVCTADVGALTVHLYVAHLHAEYDASDDEYCTHRVSQAFDTAQLIDYTACGADLCILGGDLNTQSTDLPYKLLCQVAQLRDCFLATGKTEAEGATNETPANSYTPVGRLKRWPDGKRIDYILFKSGGGTRVEVVDCFKPLADRVPGSSFSYSDHEAVCATLKVDPPQSGLPDRRPLVVDRWSSSEPLEEAVALCDQSLRRLTKDRLTYWLLATCVAVLTWSLPNSLDAAVWHYSVGVLRLVAILAGAYFLMMAAVWNRVERHGISSCKLALAARLATPITDPASE